MAEVPREFAPYINSVLEAISQATQRASVISDDFSRGYIAFELNRSYLALCNLVKQDWEDTATDTLEYELLKVGVGMYNAAARISHNVADIGKGEKIDDSAYRDLLRLGKYALGHGFRGQVLSSREEQMSQVNREQLYSIKAGLQDLTSYH